MLTLNDLYEEAERFLWDKYGMTLLIDIDIEDDLEDIQGCYEFTASGPRRIVIADFVMDFAEDEVVYDILRHELIHYAMHRLRKQFADGQPEFEAELEKHGVGSTGTYRMGRYQLYECQGCHAKLPFHRQFEDHELKTVVTACCDAKFTNTGEQAVYNGKERLY